MVECEPSVHKRQKRLDELELFPLLNFLNQTDVLESGPNKVPLLHLEGRVRLTSQGDNIINILLNTVYIS